MLLAGLPLVAAQSAHAADDEMPEAGPVVNVVEAGGKAAPRAPEPGLHFFDGDLTLTWAILTQLDWGSYSQTPAAAALPTTYGPDLDGGFKARRLQLAFGVQLFKDWDIAGSYRLVGGDGAISGALQTLGLQYNGLKNFSFRVGAFGLPTNLDSATATPSTLFLERSAVSDLQRGLAGALGRYGIATVYGSDRIFGLFGLTGGRLNDHQPLDSQQAVVGRLSGMVVNEADTHLMIGVNGTYIIKLADPVPGAATASATDDGAGLAAASLSSVPELRVDSKGTSLLRTGSLPANHISQWGVEAAGTWKNFYAQSGYYAFLMDRAPISYRTFSSALTTATTVVQPDNNKFSGWYMQGSWVLTGETKAYNPGTGFFRPPRPADPFTPGKWGLGAWEVAARYSKLNLNDNELDSSAVITGWTGASNATYTFYNTVRGGEQGITTLGLNWYPSSSVRMLFNYQWTDINRLQAAGTVTTSGIPILPAHSASQSFEAAALRMQVGL